MTILVNKKDNKNVINKYYVKGLTSLQYNKAKYIVFAEAPLDDIYMEKEGVGTNVPSELEIGALPGQYDARADYTEKALKVLFPDSDVEVRTSILYRFNGKVNIEDKKAELINPVEQREIPYDAKGILPHENHSSTPIKKHDDFLKLNKDGLTKFIKDLGLAMDLADISLVQECFANEGRTPTETEIRVLDTYWSDHCRHTTFNTVLDKVEIEDQQIKATFDKYVANHSKRPLTLMNVALGAMRELKPTLKNLDLSEEINACSIIEKIKDGEQEKEYLIQFKNETHNHPTEIEPFGGAATCLGGAIRDPLSGRAYVYQAYRVTGAGNPFTPKEKTPKGKLTQRRITQTAAKGYSSYGNQIGLATGKVAEIYDDGYIAKRMELGAVVGACPRENVIREVPESGDVVILLGGRTGRDGVGGATGSSKEHTEDVIDVASSEVQKGNPPLERAIMRMFLDKSVTTKIRRMNDFGAGGVSVAIGELADSLEIYLDKVPKKYAGLNATEIAISESQERMALVVRKEDADYIIKRANEENLEATIVAKITDTGYMVMKNGDDAVAKISREFIDTNGATKTASAKIEKTSFDFEDKKFDVKALEVASQYSLQEIFDSTIGARTVLAPYGGKNQLTPTLASVMKIPTAGETDSATYFTHAYYPDLAKKSPYHASAIAVLLSVCKLIAAGGEHKKIYFTFQEYFEKLGADPEKWGKPLAALLGAYKAQIELGLASIGGKDSMSGTFEDLTVPPTLVSFAICVSKAKRAISPEFKKTNSNLYLARMTYKNGMPDFEKAKEIFDIIEKNNEKILSCNVIENIGLNSIAYQTFGNDIGARLDISGANIGSFIIESDAELPFERIGETIDGKLIINGKSYDIQKLKKENTKPLVEIFPTSGGPAIAKTVPYNEKKYAPKIKIAKPKVVLPVFPGTNCELDMSRAFQKAGGESEFIIMRDLTPSAIADSINALADKISNSQILALSGGFSAGDEPEGSAKYIVAYLKNDIIKEAIHGFLNRGGLVLGICNGFQALIKLGLLPNGEITDQDEMSPTLTYNTCKHHVAKFVTTKVNSTLSPWLSLCNAGDEHVIPISHGEGRFVGRDIPHAQIATRYLEHNPNGSALDIEGITDATGQILGKMGHSERFGAELYRNIPGNHNQRIFEAGIKYFNY
ncbi:phosphoribosylformylglycinamidine synthase [Treponema sp. R6D11]